MQWQAAAPADKSGWLNFDMFFAYQPIKDKQFRSCLKLLYSIRKRKNQDANNPVNRYMIF
jgi:hypothetical protein